MTSTERFFGHILGIAATGAGIYMCALSGIGLTKTIREYKGTKEDKELIKGGLVMFGIGTLMVYGGVRLVPNAEPKLKEKKKEEKPESKG